MIISGIILKRALQGAGIKQDQAAKMLGVSRPTLSVWCNKDSLSKEIIQNVKTKLGIDLLKALVADESTEISDGSEVINEINARLDRIMQSAQGLSQDSPINLVESLKETIKSKDETIKALRDQVEYLKDRLSQYEDKPKTGTN